MGMFEQVALIANISTIVGLLIVLANVLPRAVRVALRLRVILAPEDQSD